MTSFPTRSAGLAVLAVLAVLALLGAAITLVLLRQPAAGAASSWSVALETPRPPEPSRADAAGSAASTAPRAAVDGAAPGVAGYGTLRVRVHRAGDAAVAGARIEADGTVLGVTDAGGELTVQLPPRAYALAVAPDSLPRGVMPPASQDVREPPPGVPDGYFGRTVRVPAGGEVTITLRAFAAASVTGIVVDTAGVPVAGCAVRLQAQGAGLAALSDDATTRADGLFAFEPVAPGTYSVAVHGTAPLASPLPQCVDVAEGARVPLPPMVAGDVPMRVVGRLLDQHGEPFAGVPVVVHPVDEHCTFGLAHALWSAVTGADGRFELHAPRALLQLQPHPAGSLLPLGAPQRLQRPLQPIAVDTRTATSGNVVDIGTLRGERSIAFGLEVEVRTDEQRVRAADPTLRGVKPPGVFVAPVDALRDEARWQRLREHDGVLRHVAEATGEAVMLIVRRRGFAPLQRELRATPGIQRLQVTYP